MVERNGAMDQIYSVEVTSFGLFSDFFKTFLRGNKVDPRHVNQRLQKDRLDKNGKPMVDRKFPTGIQPALILDKVFVVLVEEPSTSTLEGNFDPFLTVSLTVCSEATPDSSSTSSTTSTTTSTTNSTTSTASTTSSTTAVEAEATTLAELLNPLAKMATDKPAERSTLPNKYLCKLCQKVVVGRSNRTGHLQDNHLMCYDELVEYCSNHPSDDLEEIIKALQVVTVKPATDLQHYLGQKQAATGVDTLENRYRLNGQAVFYNLTLIVTAIQFAHAFAYLYDKNSTHHILGQNSCTLYVPLTYYAFITMYIPFLFAVVLHYLRDVGQGIRYYTVMTDGWTGNRRSYRGVILPHVCHKLGPNFLKLLFLDLGVHFNPERGNAVNIGSFLQQLAGNVVMNKNARCIGVVADNASTEIASARNARLVHYRCFAHYLSLVIKWGALNAHLMATIDECSHISSTILNSHILLQEYNTVLEKRAGAPPPPKATTLLVASPTRFGGSILVVQALYKNYDRVVATLTQSMVPDRKKLATILVMFMPYLAWIDRLGGVEYNHMSEVPYMTSLLYTVAKAAKAKLELPRHAVELFEEYFLEKLVYDPLRAADIGIALADQIEQRLIPEVFSIKNVYIFGAMLDERYASKLPEYIANVGGPKSRDNYVLSFRHFVKGMTFTKTYTDAELDEKTSILLTHPMTSTVMPEPLSENDPLQMWRDRLDERSNPDMLDFCVRVLAALFCILPTSTHIERSFKAAADNCTPQRRRMKPLMFEIVHLLKKNINTLRGMLYNDKAMNFVFRTAYVKKLRPLPLNPAELVSETMVRYLNLVNDDETGANAVPNPNVDPEFPQIADPNEDAETLPSVVEYNLTHPPLELDASDRVLRELNLVDDDIDDGTSGNTVVDPYEILTPDEEVTDLTNQRAETIQIPIRTPPRKRTRLIASSPNSSSSNSSSSNSSSSTNKSRTTRPRNSV